LGDAAHAPGEDGAGAARGRGAGDGLGGSQLARSRAALALRRPLRTPDEEGLMRRTSLLDSIAQRLLELGRISPTQWLLRTLGAVATLLALLLVSGPASLFSNVGTLFLTLAVAAGVVLHCRRPDSDLGLLAPAAILLALLAADGSSMLQAAGVGLA